jgi:hypothetical protein
MQGRGGKGTNAKPQLYLLCLLLHMKQQHARAVGGTEKQAQGHISG